MDETSKILTLEAEGPNFMQAGRLARFRDVYEFKTPDDMAISSSMQADDGTGITFMTGDAHRKKK